MKEQEYELATNLVGLMAAISSTILKPLPADLSDQVRQELQRPMNCISPPASLEGVDVSSPAPETDPRAYPERR